MNHFDLMIYRSTHQALFVKDQSFSFRQMVVATYKIKWRGKTAPTFSTADTLPTGVSLSSNGIVSYDGTIIQTGVTNWTVTATDGVDTVTANMTLTITPAQIEITDGQVFSFQLGQTASMQIQYVADGTPTFAVTSGTLPSGVTMTTGGLLEYDGTGSEDTVSFEVTATLQTSASDTSTIGIKLSTLPVDYVFYAPFDVDINDHSASSRAGTAVDAGASNVVLETYNGIKSVYIPDNARITYPIGNVNVGNTAKSMSLWIYRSNTSSGWNVPCGVGNNGMYELFSIGINGNRFYYGGYYNDIDSGVAVTSTWTHLVITYDTTAIRMYFNGELVKTQNTTSVNTANNLICVGGRPASSDNYCEACHIAGVRIYNRALTDLEVLDLYGEF